MKYYATIRKESKYWHQQEIDADSRPIPFSVHLDIDSDPFWPVKGGVGGNYAIYDVDLWIQHNGNLVKLPVHDV